MKGETMKDKKKIIGVIAIIVAILAIAVTIGMYFYRNAKPEEKEETKKGTVELFVKDQENFPARAAIFQLSQVYSEDNKQKIMEVTPGDDGVVNFYDVPEGEYELEVIEEKEGYTFADNNKVKRFYLAAGKGKTITWPCKRSIGLLMVTVVDKQNTPIKDMEIELIGEDEYIRQTDTTDSDGKAYFHIQDEGTYYFRQNPDCEKAKEYELDESLYKVTIDAENLTFNKDFINTRKTSENE